MSDEYEEQALEPDEYYEEDYVDSIAMLELLVKPGKTIGQCHFNCRFHC